MSLDEAGYTCETSMHALLWKIYDLSEGKCVRVQACSNKLGYFIIIKINVGERHYNKYKVENAKCLENKHEA